MSSRLDRLVSLLESGSSSSIRQTAAKQLAQLATKNVPSDISFVDDSKHHVADYSSLMPVVSRILPCLRSKNFETRTSASSALSQICNAVPIWTPSVAPSNDADEKDEKDGPVPYPPMDLMALMYQTAPLVASTGKEFSKPATTYSNINDLKKAKKEAMKRLGIDFLEGVDDGMDWEAELGNGGTTPDSEGAVKTEEETIKEKDKEKAPTTREEIVLPRPPGEQETRPTSSAGLSARELNRLKRKRKGGAAAVAPPKPSPDSKYATTIARDSSPKVRLLNPHVGESNVNATVSSPSGQVDEKVVIDPSKGGQVEAAQSNMLSLAKMIEVSEGHWPWEGVIRVLEVDLFDPSWTTRHGAACAIRDILKPQGSSAGMSAKLSASGNRRAHELWCNDLAAKILCVLTLDRFCDFSSDQSVSPVRETAAQTLASLFMHMPKCSLYKTHEILLQMARQDFSTEDPTRPYIWQVRHGGMLGLKYEVAVRRDLFIQETTHIVKKEDTMDVDEATSDFLKSVVSTAILGLGDSDDDVRSVGASTLIPVAGDIVKLLPDDLPLVLAVLWDGLANMKDDLSSSVGAVMELLGKLVAFPEVISILGNPDSSKPLSSLAPTLFSFFRHTIANVRLQVVTTLHSFLLVDELPKNWLSSGFLCLLFQNLLVEERAHIREATLGIWKTSIRLLSEMENVLPAVVTSELISDWFALMLQPWGHPLEFSLFFQVPPHGVQSNNNSNSGKLQERHNVDKAMLLQDVALVTAEVIWESRIACAQAIGYLIAIWPSSVEADTVFRSIILHYLSSNSALQRVIASVVAEECANEIATLNSSNGLETSSRTLDSNLVAALADTLLNVVNQSAIGCYLETLPNLRRLSSDCSSLLSKFAASGSISVSDMPNIPLEIDTTGQRADSFTLDVAQRVAGPIFDDLKARMPRMKKRELATYEALRTSLFSHIESWNTAKDRYDVRVLAAAAATLVALESVPVKVGSVIKSLMNGIKFEETLIFQKRFSSSLAGMVDLGLAKLGAVVPLTKVVKNLCAFLCSDPSQTPSFDPTSDQDEGVLSFRMASSSSDRSENPETPEQSTARISRRGAELALGQLSRRFGSQLFERVPMIWQSTTDGLVSACQGGELEGVNRQLEKRRGQDAIDSLITIQTLVPTLHSDLYPRVVDLLPLILLMLRSRFPIIRQTAARCLSMICDVITVEGMCFTVQHLLPLLGNAKSATDRQGAIEAVYNIVARLDSKALPYVIFLVVPVLGRMSDPDDDIRSTSTNTFASLVKMVPLEVGLPDPEGFPSELLERRDKERGFLSQLLDGSKVEHYEVPVPIKAELRKYQVDGVNWLAFLAKYQLHGVLCDDMGLGKTLQSICILAGKHYERSERHRTAPGPDTAHIPSLIVCPPTLTGHWYYEIQKYAETLRPVLYTGAARERSKVAHKLTQYDIVITSYEVVRNDIQCLSALDWLYCILDEGHVIKNAKTKLSKAVKSIRAQHRVILSGTPIQNNVLELWSLFDFLMPGFLGNERSFNERYGKPILANRDSKSSAKTSEAAALALEALHKQVLPFLLRRLKEDVLDDLPPKIIQDYYCELSDLQKQLYDDFSESDAYVRAQAAVKTNGTGGVQQHVFQSLQYLKKVCNHPALVLKEGDTATKKILEKFRKINDNASPLRDLTHAPKLQALRQLLNDCGIGLGTASSGDDNRKCSPTEPSIESSAFSQHRVLIFCQMKQMIDIIENDLFKPLMPTVTYMRLDGGTDTHKRHAIVQTFNADPSIDCLLLTTHVGGLGLTLTGADTVIFVEHDWNPMKDLQAMDRAHRIGQKKVVNVYRLITKDTLEEKIMGLQRFKLNIANSVITQQNSGLSSMSTDLVLDLFKRTSEEESGRKRKARDGPINQKNILAGLEELSAEGEYDSLDLSSFLSN